MTGETQTVLRNGITLLALACGVLFVAAFKSSKPELTPAVGDGIPTLPALNDNCDADCDTHECTGHAWLTIGAHEGWLNEGDTHTCHSWASCESHGHEECEWEEEEEELEDFLLALGFSDASTVEQAIAQNPKRVFWNSGRQALQVWGCGHKVVASIRLNPDQAPADLD